MKSKIQLLSLNVERGDMLYRGNDVYVEYEYDDIQHKEVHLFLKAEVGGIEHCRFCLKICYLLNLIEEYEDEDQKIKVMLDRVSDSLMDIIVTIDNIFKQEE